HGAASGPTVAASIATNLSNAGSPIATLWRTLVDNAARYLLWVPPLARLEVNDVPVVPSPAHCPELVSEQLDLAAQSGALLQRWIALNQEADDITTEVRSFITEGVESLLSYASASLAVTLDLAGSKLVRSVLSLPTLTAAVKDLASIANNLFG